MPGDGNPLRTSELELKWYTHAKGETRSSEQESLVLTVRWPSLPPDKSYMDSPPQVEPDRY